MKESQTNAPIVSSKLTANVGGAKVTFKKTKKGLVITAIKAKKSTFTVPKTVKIQKKKYTILGFDKNAFKGCKKIKTVKLRAKFTFAKNSVKGLNKKAKFLISKKYFKVTKKRLIPKRTGYKKSMKVKRG